MSSPELISGMDAMEDYILADRMTIQKWIRMYDFPQHTYGHRNRCIWRKDWVDAWIHSNRLLIEEHDDRCAKQGRIRPRNWEVYR